jgi:serine/threonine-protein kinase/endoribonuclease IRE1
LLGQRQSFALDVWGFGCLTYFVLSKGFHPFGSRVHREANILANKINLVRVTDPVALHLISKCLQSEAQKRPSMMEVLQHPLFWDKHKRLLFLLDVSDLLEVGEIIEERVSSVFNFLLVKGVGGKHS